MENLKKIAKNTGTRLNNEFTERSEHEIRKLATTTNTHVQNTSAQGSKRSILNNIKRPPKQVGPGREFVIKQKARK